MASYPSATTYGDAYEYEYDSFNANRPPGPAAGYRAPSSTSNGSLSGLKPESPLASLVRRSSSRRGPSRLGDDDSASTYYSNNDYYEQYFDAEHVPSREANMIPRIDVQDEGPLQQQQQQRAVPASPLLHSHFSRSSFATVSSAADNSYSRYSRSEDGDTRESVYSQSSLAPTVYMGGELREVATNFSQAVVGRGHEGVRVAPQLPAGMREGKMKVLERNARPGSMRTVVKAELTTAQEFLQMGIQHHEANRLSESARCFERSANEGGGCGVGMLMYGLTLRHGWGCAKNEKMGFRWLMKAAEHAVGDLERARTTGGREPVSVIETELVLAIYEVGQCFFHGWGVQKDQKMAVSYYSVAARLGDGDAQADLAYCLANGKGCKKDKKEAADWYRKAIAQGQSDVGLAWIYKDKYN